MTMLLWLRQAASLAAFNGARGLNTTLDATRLERIFCALNELSIHEQDDTVLDSLYIEMWPVVFTVI